jgi:hypothetical protein
MSALSEFVLRHKVMVILFWLAVFACGVFASSEVGERTAREEWAEHQRRACALFERLTEEDKRELLGVGIASAQNPTIFTNLNNIRTSWGQQLRWGRSSPAGTAPGSKR